MDVWYIVVVVIVKLTKSLTKMAAKFPFFSFYKYIVFNINKTFKTY